MSRVTLGWVEREAREVLGSPADSIEPLTHSTVASVTLGVFRVRAGSATAIAKVVAPRPDDPLGASHPSLIQSSFRYWRREVMLLASPALDAYRAAGLRPPALLAAIERPDGSIAIWQEAAGGIAGDEWTVEQFGDAARRLGVAQAAWAGRALPMDLPWSRGFLREYLAEKGATIPYAVLGWNSAWDTPLVAAHFPASLRDELTSLHADQGRLVRWAETAPRTLAHLDVWPRNLFAAPDDLILIDWAFAGDGGLGEDAGNLVFDTVLDLLHPASLLPALDAAIFARYLAGLRDGGWTGDERAVRLAMCASAVKYDWLGPAMVRRAGEVEMVGYGGGAVADRERLYAERGVALAFIVERADEARRLARELGVD